MNMPSDDRLRAFLERNRNRISHHSHSSSLHILDKDILGPLNNEDIDKCIEVNKSIQRDSTLCGENNNKGNEYEIEKESRNIQTNKKQVQKENNPQSSSAYFSIISSELMGSNMLNQTPKKTLSQKYLKPSLLKGFGSNKILSMTLDSTGKFTDSSKKRLMSNSPSCSSPFENSIGIMKNKNFIETYIHKRKVTRNKMRARVRSLSTESGNSFRSLKFNLGTLNKSTIKQKPFESTSGSSKGYESREFVASSKAQAIDQLTKPNIYDVLYAKETKKPTAAKETKAQVNQTMENKEYCFEEMENSRIEKNKVKNVHKTHSKSKSTSIHISPVPMTKEKPKKFEAKIINTNPEGRGRSRDVSINTVNTSKEESKFFPESSKKLELLDNSMEKNHKFKKEIKNLIGIIKKEREQISNELNSMAKELKKYKAAYKKLKKEIVPNSTKKTLQSHNPEQTPVISSNLSKSMCDDRLSLKEHDEKALYPFTINELTQYIENSAPVYNEENIEELLSKIDSVHTDVESILNRNDNSGTKSPQGKNPNLKSFELRKTFINCHIVKEMNLPVTLFFQEINAEDLTDTKPNLIDLLSAQREIIYFLVKKLQIEEQQRLKTEEQASRMILHMEKTVKQLEGKSMSLKKKEPFSPLDLNKSMSTLSHNTNKCETPNDMI